MRWLGCSFQFIKITLRKETWLSVMFFDNSSRDLSVERFVIGMYSGSMIREVSNGCWPSKPKSHDPATREVPLDCGWGEALPNSASNFAFISLQSFLLRTIIKTCVEDLWPDWLVQTWVEGQDLQLQLLFGTAAVLLTSRPRLGRCFG